MFLWTYLFFLDNILVFSRYHMDVTNNHTPVMCKRNLDEDVSDVGDVRQAEHTCPTALHRPPLPSLKTSLGPSGDLGTSLTLC